MLKFLSICLAVASCQAGPLPNPSGSPSFSLVQEILNGQKNAAGSASNNPSSVLDDYLRGTVRDGILDVSAQRPAVAPAIPVVKGTLMVLIKMYTTLIIQLFWKMHRMFPDNFTVHLEAIYFKLINMW